MKNAGDTKQMPRTTPRTSSLRRTGRWMSAMAVLALVLAPALAEARAGGSSNSGSRGARTYSAPPATQTAPATARPLERTATQPGATQAAPAAARPGVPAAAGASRFGTGFMGGMMGGLLGVGLFGLLTGAGLFGGFAGFASILGFLLQIALIGGLVFLVVRLFRASRPQTAPAIPPQAMAREMHSGPRPMAGGLAPTQPVQVSPADFEVFGARLVAVQEAWTRGDRDAMARVATPEMLSYFEQDWSDLAARGWRNEVRDVALEQGDLSEAWREGAREYATVAMRFSMLDVTRSQDGTVVEGSAEQRQTATEVWTFVRVAPAGDWMLSAIQQAG
jgi:predicted lipid-binding transport protein (Tim44 family)